MKAPEFLSEFRMILTIEVAAATIASQGGGWNPAEHLPCLLVRSPLGMAEAGNEWTHFRIEASGDADHEVGRVRLGTRFAASPSAALMMAPTLWNA